MTALAVDYFCGAGGASIGLRAAGYKVFGYDNWDMAVAAHNAGGLVAHLHDLSNALLDDCLPLFPQVAWFSPPCPPFSAAGKGTGFIDPRDGFPWALRIIRETRPWVVFIENVKGLTSKRHLWYLASVMTALRTYGYDAEWRVLNAADYGVPQTRQRCFIVARRDGQPVRWPEPTHTREQWVSMATALGWTADALVGFPRRADAGRATIDLGGVEYRARDLFPSDGPAQTVTEKGRSWQRFELNTGRDWKPGGSRDSAQRIALDSPAPTVLGTSGAWQVRSADYLPIRVTVAELAQLQDFPACWPWQGTKTQQCHQIGNAVPPRMARRIAEVNR